jgi:hypothetical protein
MPNPKEECMECMKRVVVIAALLAAVGSVAAEEQSGPGACRADAEKLCKGVEPGKGRVAQCLKEHESQVSSGCKAHMSKMHEQMQAFNDACKADVEKNCKGVEPGQGRMMGCLRKNEANLSAPCKEQIAKMDERRGQMHERMHNAAEACKGDVQQYCANVQPGGGRVARCLKENEAKLAAPCKAAMQPSKNRLGTRLNGPATAGPGALACLLHHPAGFLYRSGSQCIPSIQPMTALRSTAGSSASSATMRPRTWDRAG